MMHSFYQYVGNSPLYQPHMAYVTFHMLALLPPSGDRLSLSDIIIVNIINFKITGFGLVFYYFLFEG